MDDKHNSTKDVILQDVRNGKERPWRRKKVRSLILANSLKRLGYDKRSERVKMCGTFLEFRILLNNVMKLLKANFCLFSLCPMCQWRKSLKIAFQVARVMDLIQIRFANFVPLFLTLTLKNCAVADISAYLDVLFSGWREFERSKKLKTLVKGYFRAVEITYDGEKTITQRRYEKNQAYYDCKGLKVEDPNPNFDTFHPHIHVIILVDKSYFETGYIETKEWSEMWKKAAKLDYNPVVDIRACRSERGKRKEVAEVAKYTLKDTQILRANDDVLTDRLVDALSVALFKRRLFAYGGVMREIAKELGMDKPGEGDLIHIDDKTIRADVAVQVERYRWRFGIANYVRF